MAGPATRIRLGQAPHTNSRLKRKRALPHACSHPATNKNASARESPPQMHFQTAPLSLLHFPSGSTSWTVRGGAALLVSSHCGFRSAEPCSGCPLHRCAAPHGLLPLALPLLLAPMLQQRPPDNRARYFWQSRGHFLFDWARFHGGRPR